MNLFLLGNSQFSKCHNSFQERYIGETRIILSWLRIINLFTVANLHNTVIGARNIVSMVLLTLANHREAITFNWRM